MNITAVLGSRDRKGRTAQAAGAFLEGAAENGAQSEKIFLPEINIERCRQCEDSGWGKCRSEGECTIEDDFAKVVSKIENADMVIFATPVYFSDLSESMRAFLDRLRRICMHERGRARIEGKVSTGICVAGGGGGGAPACAVNLERILQRCGFQVEDMVPARRQNLDLKLALLNRTGQWFTAQKLSK